MTIRQYLIFTPLLALFLASECASDKSRIFGVTLVAPHEQGESNPLIPAKDMGFGWMAIVPYGFVQKDSARVRYAESANHMMWGERPEGIRASVHWAREQGMKTMLKPQVWSGRTWIGALSFQEESDWQRFEASYARYILQMAGIAQEEGIEMLCIGTELSNASMQRTQFWRDLIADIRKTYKGKLTYSANWDNWEQVPFWRDLDFIGLGSYFPLSQSPSPTLDSLRLAWAPLAVRMEAMSKAVHKPILFTEMGYLGVPGCCGRLWELEPKRDELPVDVNCQARAFEALLSVFLQKDWWAGGFVWKYYPQPQMRPRHGDKDYDIQGKPVGEVFKRALRE